MGPQSGLLKFKPFFSITQLTKHSEAWLAFLNASMAVIILLALIGVKKAGIEKHQLLYF